MSLRRGVLSLVFLLIAAASAVADTVRVTAERALVWTRPEGVSVVITQLMRGATAEVVRRVGDWYEIIIPTGTAGAESRRGYIRASQVVLDSVGPQSPQAAAAARQPRPPTARQRTRFLNIDGGYRVGHADLTRTATAFREAFAEEGTITANYGKGSGPAFDVMGGQMFSQSFGIGLGLSYFLRDQPVTVEARVPHPFYFNQLRSASSDSESVRRQEAALHIPLLWIPSSGATRIVVYGGPSIFSITQTVVTDLVLDDRYPYDTVAIRGIDTAERTATLFGYHAGGDVTYFLTPSIGIGGGVRYSRAELQFEDDDATTDGSAGAVQGTVGVRIRF